MSKKNIFRLVVFSLIGILIACNRTGNDSDKGEVQFGFQKKAVLSKILAKVNATEEDAHSVRFKVHKQGSGPATEYKVLPLNHFESQVVTEAESYEVGTYVITDFQVLDNASNIIYATPKAGSETAHLVQNPLDVIFEVRSEETKTITMEVIDVTGLNAGSFGYPSFDFDIVPTFSFLMATSVYDGSAQGYELVESEVVVTVAGNTNFDGSIGAYTDTLQVKDIAGATYSISIRKEGYGDTTLTFMNEELKVYSKIPLHVRLNKSPAGGFSGPFATSNWSFPYIGPYTSYTFDEEQLYLNVGRGGGGLTASITIPTSGTLRFDWEVVWTGSNGDAPGTINYEINTEPRVLIGSANRGASPSGGTASIAVQAGDVFQFVWWGGNRLNSYYGTVKNFRLE